MPRCTETVHLDMYSQLSNVNSKKRYRSTNLERQNFQPNMNKFDQLIGFF